VESLGIVLHPRTPVNFRHAIPQSLLPFVQTAAYFNALGSFGSDLQPARPITRGQALQVIMHLKNQTPANPYAGSFSDVTGSPDLQNAVELSLENEWLLPISAKSFGVDRPLSGADARALLNNVLASSASSSSSSVSSRPSRAQSSSSSAGMNITAQELNQPLPNETMLRAVWQLLNDQYLYSGKLDAQQAAYAAAQALVNSLNDPYTVFMPPQDAQEFNTQINGQLTGIGAQVEYDNNILTVVAPLAGSPALRAGIQAGDQILKADGQDITNIGFSNAVSKIRGPKGTVVTLHIRRQGSEFDVKVTRDVITIPEVDVSYQGAIAVVKLAQFGQTTQDKFRSLMQDVATHHPVGLILDLRNDPGGLLDAADEVLSNFLPKGTVVAHVVGRTSQEDVSTNETPTIDPSTKMIVLINKGSASASEITAAALQDYKRATIVGVTSYGKGTVQRVLQFSDGSNLKMTIAEWLSPLKHALNHVGVTPDVVVQTQTGSTADSQMQRAMDLLR
jgi:carboxyl-terminal processing protease